MIISAENNNQKISVVAIMKSKWYNHFENDLQYNGK